MKRLMIPLLLIVLTFHSQSACADDPFVLRKKQELALIGGSAAILLLGAAVYERSIPSGVQTLNSGRIFPPDRFAVRCSCRGAAEASDALMAISIGFPLLFSSKRTILPDGLMMIESNLLSEGITQLCKGIFQRPRPYAYRQEYRGKPLKKDAFRSFISGHTSAAFNGAVLAGFVYQKRHPKSKFVRVVWLSGLTLATATGVCRVLSGNHFPTDVAAGALVGAFTGWLIPQLHL
jgi:hypothetical protein